MLLDGREGSVDGVVVGDVALGAEQPLWAPDDRWVTATLWPSAASRRATASTRSPGFLR